MITSNVSPRDQLPALGRILDLTPTERELALEKWVSWLNGNRHRVSGQLEQQIDRALSELQEDRTPSVDISSIETMFDQWLESAGHIGEGESPDDPQET